MQVSRESQKVCDTQCMLLKLPFFALNQIQPTVQNNGYHNRDIQRSIHQQGPAQA